MLTSYSGFSRWGCRRTFGLTRSGLTSQSSEGVCSKRFSVFSEGFNEISPVEDMVDMEAPCRFSFVASG